MKTKFEEFIRGFAEGLGTNNIAEADAQWAAFSRNLSDAEREKCEDGGYEMGRAMGEECRMLK